MNATKISLALGLAASALTGCGGDGAATPEPTVEQQGAAVPPQAGGAAAPAAANLWNAGQAKPLDIQVAHPNGTVLQLTSLKSQADSTTLGVRVINGRERDVELNRWNRRRGYILLDTGERLYISPSASNTALSVPAGQTFEGELVFLGRLPPVRSATLVLNENSQTDNEYTATPGFRVDLPVNAGSQGAAQ